MAIRRFFTTPATISTPTGASTTDAEGVPTATGASANVLCHVQPYTGQDGEQTLGQDEAERARRVWFPTGITITARSSVALAGESYEVRGDPKTWQVGASSDHVEVTLVRVVR